MIDFGLLCPAPKRAHLEDGTLDLALPFGGQLRVSMRPELPPQGFELRTHGEQLLLEGADDAGVRHGMQCLRQIVAQLARQPGATRVALPRFSLSDAPDFAVR